MLQLLLEQIVVTVKPSSEWVELVLHWAGGHNSQTRMRRPVGKLSQMERHQELLEEIRKLRQAGYTAAEIAERLNAAGWTTPTQKNGFNARLVLMMLHRHGSVPRGPKPPPSDDKNLWWLQDLADELEMHVVTLYGWMRRGWLKAQRVRGRWAILADKQECARLRRLRRRHPSKRSGNSRIEKNPM